MNCRWGRLDHDQSDPGHYGLVRNATVEYRLVGMRHMSRILVRHGHLNLIFAWGGWSIFVFANGAVWIDSGLTREAVPIKFVAGI